MDTATRKTPAPPADWDRASQANWWLGYLARELRGVLEAPTLRVRERAAATLLAYEAWDGQDSPRDAA